MRFSQTDARAPAVCWFFVLARVIAVVFMLGRAVSAQAGSCTIFCQDLDNDCAFYNVSTQATDTCDECITLSNALVCDDNDPSGYLWVSAREECVNIPCDGEVVLTVHGNVEGVETNGDPCGALIPADLFCQDTDPNSVPDSFGVEWFIAVAAGLNPLAFTTITFGIGDYDPYACYVASYGPCSADLGPLEITSDGWPGPMTGTSVSWAPNCLTGMLVPVYYFGFYVYYGGGPVPLGDFFPGQTAAVVSCDDPPVEEPITGFGVMGCGDDPGQQECPEGPPMGGACCVDGNGDGNPETCIDIMSEDECVSIGGIYQGDGTACGPNNEPCPEDPVATERSTWGQIKAMYK